MNVPVFDLHCDTALALLGETVNEAGSLKKNSYHIDLERASRLEAYCQCFACYTTPMMQERFGASPVVVFEREIATIQREVEHNKNMIRCSFYGRGGGKPGSGEDVSRADHRGACRF